jgi:hypothetical protein
MPKTSMKSTPPKEIAIFFGSVVFHDSFKSPTSAFQVLSLPRPSEPSKNARMKLKNWLRHK